MSERTHPLRRLRDRLNWSREQLAKHLDCSSALIQSYERDLSPALAERAQALAESRGLLDLAAAFAAYASTEESPKQHGPISLADITDEERYQLHGYLEIKRNPDPDSDLQKAFPDLLTEILNCRKRQIP